MHNKNSCHTFEKTMELKTVNQIREKRDEIREQIKGLNLRDYSDTKYGGENEYSFKGLIGGN